MTTDSLIVSEWRRKEKSFEIKKERDTRKIDQINLIFVPDETDLCVSGLLPIFLLKKLSKCPGLSVYDLNQLFLTTVQLLLPPQFMRAFEVVPTLYGT